jgi:hypothetical protein
LEINQDFDKDLDLNMGIIRILVEPGICGFSCQVEARRQDKQHAIIEITGSGCELIQKMTESLKDVTLEDIFTPHTKNPVFKAAELAGCHLTCPVPIAVLKAAEVVLELALPKSACINFVQYEKKDTT